MDMLRIIYPSSNNEAPRFDVRAGFASVDHCFMSHRKEHRKYNEVKRENV